uniref:NADH-ubiquinone oxidoreductase chain 5 n=1 Tax=Macrocentrus camphoraphilus TaxID=684659 RepID=D8WHD2_9HYME|nr:NADH dehydrogenase subunit 5 [Macrocentrus camphoraphilus]
MMYFLISFYMLIFSIITNFLMMMFIKFNLKLLINFNFKNMLSMKIEFIMFFDWMNFMFMSTILLISSMVFLYSMNYMKLDKNLNRFMKLILIFIMSMIFMIISPNFISIMLGWDGLGLSSYLLVKFYQNFKSLNSSLITLLMNRIGDIMILMMISLMMYKNSWNFMFINNINQKIMMLILITSMTKSAQIPFSTWLPLAMAAPTPVSSLVHSSTLVTAGVYLLIRFNYLMNEYFMKILMMISLTTMLMSSMNAMLEFDLKKIIALSTLSQLALMMFSISLNLTNLTFFHLITHAMFKSLLFLCSGIMIHNYFNNQDIRFINQLNLNMPSIMIIFNVASFTLSGMPFMSGFYSKDLILEMFMMNLNNKFIYMMFFLSMSLTLMYSIRLIYYISIYNLNLNMNSYFNLNSLMNNSIIVLFMLTMFYGSMFNWMIFNSKNMIFLNMNMKIMIYYFILIFNLMYLYLFINKFIKKSIMKLFMLKFLNQMWFINLIYKKKYNIMMMNNKYIKIMENSWLEYFNIKKMLNFKLLMNMKMIKIKINLMSLFMFTIYLIILNLF